MRIDAHQHFWRYQLDTHGWISDEMSVLRNDFMPEEFKTAFIHHGIDASILQSCQYYSEQALHHLDALSCREEQKSLLRETIESLLHRNH